MGGNNMKKLILFLIVAALASCSAPQKGYDYKHHSNRQQKMYKQTKRVNKGKSQLNHQCTPKKHR
jgi:hypothetical protein